MTYRHGSFEVIDLDVANHVGFANYATGEVKVNKEGWKRMVVQTNSQGLRI